MKKQIPLDKIVSLRNNENKNFDQAIKSSEDMWATHWDVNVEK